MTTLILTHEQADFDAVASLWATHRLHAHATPVLPRRINRNVHAFLTLYGEHFKFTETEDLSRHRVDDVIIVDAQSTSSVKGMNAKTRLTVIDHHPLNGDAATGANTTLLIERMVESLLPISPIEATLFLIGIYEDTGALTYLTTTARDARAAAHLIECSAQLDIVREFLNHPLSPAQKKLHDQLLNAAETHFIHGQPVTVCAIDGGDTTEELSTLAHSIRDTLDPSALFLLVQLSGHESRVQLIARSTVKNVDVGAAASHFGGGGHGRAAAAIIRNKSLNDVRDELISILPNHIQPVTTVAQIMSSGVQTLTPDVTIREAATRMQRYGYEGYPVVAENKVVGLLTRRAVDRAMHHNIGAQPISSIMEMGEVIVSPNDSLDHLQRLMITHGWGQVPVVENDSIIGVVTRTDLIKRTVTPTRAAKRNLANELSASLPKGRLDLIHLVSNAAAELNDSLFIVGGFVRDLILGTPSTDFDLVVEGEAIKLANKLAAQYGGKVTAHSQFGTAKWKLPSTFHLPTLDFVTARSEFYPHPSALPEVERGSIKLDLHRRDFTVNTLALRLDKDAFGDLLDFWGGEKDLRDGLIRVLHSISFVDDPTRILRAARFEQRFNFKIESRTLELIAHALPLLDRVSGDRIRHELEAMLKEREPEKHLTRLGELGILKQIHPDLDFNGDVAKRFVALRNPVGATLAVARHVVAQYAVAQHGQGQALPLQIHFALWLSSLPHDSLEEIIARLRFSAKTADVIRQASEMRLLLPHLMPELKFSELHTALGEFDRELMPVLLIMCDDDLLRAHLTEYASRITTVHIATDGDTLKALGLTPSPQFKRIITRLQDAYLDGEIKNVEEEKTLLERIVLESKTERSSV
jgi:tRNA nucleotidyltransferase (CCA-adding enzyme)